MAGKVGVFLLSDGATNIQELRAELQAALALLGEAMSEPEPPTGPFPAGHIATQVDDKGRIVVPEGACPFHVSGWIRTYFPQDVWGDAARISKGESNWNKDATNDTRHMAGGRCGERYWLASAGIWASTEYSVGLFQINICAHGGTFEQWSDMDANCKKAAELYHARGDRWDDWAYTAGRLGLL